MGIEQPGRHAATSFRVLLIGTESLFGEGLRQLLASLPYAVAVERAARPEDLAGPPEQGFDLVFTGVTVPGTDHADVVRSLRAAVGDRVPIAVLALVDSAPAVRSAIAAGAAGYLPITAPARVIRHAVELMLSGGIYLPPSVVGRGEPQPSSADGPVAAHLTRRQKAVLAELAKGQSNKQIAGVLNLSEATVKVHIAAIMRALLAHNRTRAVIAATEAGLLREAAG
jgi:DNA-binding NarL/FixJ family response regulator